MKLKYLDIELSQYINDPEIICGAQKTFDEM